MSLVEYANTDGIAVLTLNNAPANCYSREMMSELDAAILASSVPQVPAVVGTMLFMMGAPLLPVVTAMAVAVLGVLSLGLRVQLGSRDQG